MNQSPTPGTPAAHGFRMPAEWEPHEATWLAWPHNRTDWPGKFAPIPWIYCEIIRHLASGERVHLIVEGPDGERAAARHLAKHAIPEGAVRFHHIPTNRSWLRDTGPIFLVRNAATRRRLVTDWHFNAWAKYDDWQLDDAVPGAVSGLLRARRVCPQSGNPRRRVVLEGGSIDVNGAGLLLTTEECLLSEVQQRNPGLGRADIERVFADWLGVRKTIWLGSGIFGDDTHGHVDDLARFTDTTTVVTVVEPDRCDPNHEPLKDNLDRLRAARDLRGQPLRIAKLPMPSPVWFDGQRLPASYANFYIANRSVLVPVFNDPNDRVALNTIQKLFPTRRAVGIYCGDLVLGLGTLHCMTQQQPAA